MQTADHEALQYNSLCLIHACERPNHQTTPIGIAEWAWQNEIITFAEMLALIEYLNTREMEPAE
jgi:hypothetical protein